MAADRAYLAGGRIGPARDALAALTARVMARFEDAGAQRVDPAALNPAETLLDIYGEDLRARAFTVDQPGGPEMMLRPDFTVPVMQLHLARRAEPARYAYLGPVWRRQPAGSGRPNEYLQAGIEIYGDDPVAADAEVFALMRAALADGGVTDPVTVVTDLAPFIDLIEAAPLSPRRRAALKRHFWRPGRFHALLRRYAQAPAAPSPMRAALLAGADGAAGLAEAAGAVIGARSLADLTARARDLAVEATEPPLPDALAALIDRALDLSCPADRAPALLAEISTQVGGGMDAAVARLSRRLDALAARGVDPAALTFRSAAARTLEYYDGFVFEMSAPDRPDLPPLAGGGRYDGIAAQLGADAPLTAVGAIVRPEALLAAGGDAPC